MRPLICSMSGRHRQGCEAAGEVATAADYNEQAQHVLDELELPPIIVSAPVVLKIVAPSGPALCHSRRAHQAGIADNVCSDDRRQFALLTGHGNFPAFLQRIRRRT